MRKLLLIAAVLFTLPSFANTIIIFTGSDGRCHYVLEEMNGKPVATWTGDCLQNVKGMQAVDIKEETKLWKELKKLDATLDLQNIQLIFIKDEPAIAKLKALSIPEINLGNRALAKSFRMDNGSATTMQKQEAQDYNSSRSNKANSISTAQDYNSSRSNKANSISTAQDYNSSRSNKANSISVINNSDSSDGNKTNSISTAQDYNSSRSNKANSISTAQDYNSSRSNKSRIVLSAGIALPRGNNFMKTGFTINAGYRIQIKNSFGIEVGIGTWSNGFSYKPSSLLPKEYMNKIEESIHHDNWKNMTVSAGPSLSFGKGKYIATLYTKAVVLFTKIPQQKMGGDNPVASFSGNETSAGFNPGLRLNYSLNSRIGLFINPEYLTSFQKNISYGEKDISKAMNADGKFNADTYQSLPLEKKYMGVNLFGVSAGLKIHL
ncbi:MAG: hypothetical protein ABI366_03800 [Ginsengibacter sp.]